MTDLIAQWLDDRVPGVDPVVLERFGVSFRAAQQCGGVRQARDGWALPVYVDPPSPWRIVDDPVLLDFVIFTPTEPSKWRTKYRQGAMLGEAALAEALDDHLPLPIYRTPLAWLQSGGAGAFPLDAGRFAAAVVGYPLLQLVGEDLDHAERLSQLIERTPRRDLPEVRVAA